MAPLLEVSDLHTYFHTKEGIVKAVNGVSFSVEADSVLGVVGESGSGKTMTALSVLRLVPFPGEIMSGRISYDGQDILKLSDNQMRRIRGSEISLIFQDAASALNPVISIGKQVEELMLEHTGMSKRQARGVTMDLLSGMGIPDAAQMLGRYPFQLSGGMAQRVMMAIGVALKPRVLIADEPTSNLDVTLQAEMLQRLRVLRQENQTAIVLITHDLGVIAQMAEKVAVMYGGYIVEFADTPILYKRPMHPYTWGLFQSLPRLDAAGQRLRPMAGAPPQMLDPPDQCPFLHRCAKATVECRTSPRPPLVPVEPGHNLACYNPMQIGEMASRN
jgi:oligopeptide/dipeptide ABC transporter ATP-binding protein